MIYSVESRENALSAIYKKAQSLGPNYVNIFIP